MSHTEGNFRFCINLAVHQGNSTPSTNKWGQGGHFDLHKFTEQVKWVLYLNKIFKKRFHVEAATAYTGAKKPNRIIKGLIPSHLPGHTHGPERKLSTWLQSPEQSCIASVVALTTKSEMFKQILFLLSRELVRGLQRGQILTKGRLVGSSSAAQHAQWYWILKKGPCQGCSKSEASPKGE